MTHFSACVGCKSRSRTCPSIIGLKTALVGYRVTSIKHNCPDRVAAHALGDAVLVETLPFLDPKQDYDEDGPPKLWFPAVFVRQFDRKGVCFIKPGALPESGSDYPFEPKAGGNPGFVSVPLTRIRSDSSREAIANMKECSGCQKIVALQGPCTSRPWERHSACEAPPFKYEPPAPFDPEDLPF